MRFLKQLHYYFIAMRREPMVAIPCPVCRHNTPELILPVDRYLLPVHVSACKQCGFIYTARNMVGEVLARFYQLHYRRYYENVAHVTARYLFSHKHRVNAATRLVRLREIVPVIEDVLEIGSGLGFFLEECRGAGAKRYLGLELGDTARHYAQHVLGLKDAILSTPYEQLDRLPFAPKLVTLFHVFEHLEDPAGFLQWLTRHMAQGGMLVIEVPDITGDWSDLGLGQFHLAHRWYFSPVSLSNLLAQHGFTPHFITRDDGDGIYPGNLRVFATLGVPAAGLYPLVEASDMATPTAIRDRVPYASVKRGLPRAAMRLVKQALRA